MNARPAFSQGGFNEIPRLDEMPLQDDEPGVKEFIH